MDSAKCSDSCLSHKIMCPWLHYCALPFVIVFSLRKCKERVKALKRMLAVDEERLKKWLHITVNDFMSTEESCEEDDATFIVCPLPWRAFKVNDFFGRLDASLQSHRSSQSRKMRNKRRTGEPSESPCPIGRYGKSHHWAFSRAYHPTPSPSTSTLNRSRN